VSLVSSSFDDVYRQWRNRARRFDPQSIVLTALEFLKRQPPTKLADLERYPWQVLLMVKWVCQDHEMDRSRAPAITQQDFDDLRQRLWDFPEQLGSRIRDTLPGKLFFRQLINPQLGFQREFSPGFVREAAILAAQPDNHPLRRLFEERTRLNLHDFLDLAFAIYCGVLEGRHAFGSEWFEPLLKVYPRDVIKAFVEAVSVDYAGLKKFVRDLPNGDRRVQSELFEFPVLTRYPLFRINGQLHCWHPMLFFRGMEGFVHSVLSELGTTYIEPFSKLFEKHVANEARTISASSFHDEADIRAWLPQGARVPDGLLSYPGCNIFIESKAKLFDESIMCVGHTERFSHMTRALRDAIEQAWSACTLLRQEKQAPEQIMNAPKDFLLIVTNWEVSASNGRALAAMYPPETLVPSIPDAINYLPLEHVYVLSIEDFERLVHGLPTAGVQLPQFLEGCVTADAKAATAVFCFQQHLAHGNIPRSYSAIVRGEIEAISARLERPFDESNR
jgi:hypothetical protein